MRRGCSLINSDVIMRSMSWPSMMSMQYFCAVLQTFQTRVSRGSLIRGYRSRGKNKVLWYGIASGVLIVIPLGGCTTHDSSETFWQTLSHLRSHNYYHDDLRRRTFPPLTRVQSCPFTALALRTTTTDGRNRRR